MGDMIENTAKGRGGEGGEPYQNLPHVWQIC